MMLPAAWQRISALSKAQTAERSSSNFGNTAFSGSRKSSLSSLSLASFASSDTSFTAISYTSHHYHTAVTATSQQPAPDLAPEQIFDDDFYEDLVEDAGCCGGAGNYTKLDCVIEENL